MTAVILTHVSHVPAYHDSLATLADSNPLIARSLRVVEERRAQHLAGYLDGTRLKGLEQLHNYLDAAVESFAAPDLASPPLRSRVQTYGAVYAQTASTNVSPGPSGMSHFSLNP
jgi:hypothetical protein